MLNKPKKYIRGETDLTLRKCFYYQWQIWNRLPVTDEDKCDVAIEMGFFTDGCPSCEYASIINRESNHKNVCRVCPSTKIWAIGNKRISRNFPECCDNGSFYEQHDNASDLDYDNQFFALLIADESKRLLQENL